ncbi:Pyruvate kinase [compost metagenome]
MSWGVIPVLRSGFVASTDEAVNSAVELARAEGHLKDGDLVVITAGVPAGATGTTNLLRIHHVGESL